MATSYENAFEEAVCTSFASIMADFGLALTQVNEWLFELRSQHCLITVILDKVQVFVDVEPARTDQVTDIRYLNKLDLGRIINCIDLHANFEYKFNREPEAVRDETDRLAKLLRQYCASFLTGNFADWSKVYDQKC